MIKLFKEINKIEPGLILSGVMAAVFEGGYIVLSLLFVQSALSMFSGESSIYNVYYVIVLGITSLVIKVLQLYCKKKYEGKCFPALLGFEKNVAKASMKADYGKTLDTEFLAMASSAQTSVCGSGIGVHLVITSFFALLTGLIGCISAGSILSEVNLALPLYCTVFVVLSSLISLKEKEKGMKFQTELDDQGRKEMHWHLLLSDFAYGKDIRLYRANAWGIGKFTSVQKVGEDLVEKVNNETILYAVSRVVVDVLRDGGVLVFLICNVLQGKLEISIFVTLLIGIRTFSAKGMQLLENGMNIKSQQKYIESYFNYTNAETEKEYKSFTQPRMGDINISNISFKYPGSDKEVIHDFSLKIEKGKKIALVGLNGAGKSTLVNLLCRFYDLQKGSITIDDIDISNYNKDEYFKILSCVFQESTPFAFTVEENITMNSSSKEKDHERITSLLKKVGLDNKIPESEHYSELSVSKRFDDNGIGLSGGEQCKLAIVRALYKEAPILIMDEPTAALDPMAEKQIYELIENLGKDKTIIFISHRMASTKFCDKVVFMEDGRIIEEGSHDVLMRKNGKYAELYRVQAKYYESGEEWIQ